jgi:hypothetical protein
MWRFNVKPEDASDWSWSWVMPQETGEIGISLEEKECQQSIRDKEYAYC